MNITERQLLALVRASLWQNPVEATQFSLNNVDWRKLGQLALQQTVGILAFEAALSLPHDLLPPKEWIKKAMAFIESNRRTHLLVDQCVAESVSELHAKGVPSILLKGQAYARAYPRSDMRQCGDIDLYIGEENYRRIYDAVKSLGWEREEKFLHDAKHYGCRLRGVRIELHRIAGQLPKSSADRRFQVWSLDQLSMSRRSIRISGKEIPLPTPTFDLVFVFLHLYLHFLSGGIGLRHVCDWTMLMHKHADNIDTRELQKKLKDFHLLKAWKSFTPIAVELLGLPKSECPFYSPDYRGKSERILSFILKEGNFGRATRVSSMRPEGYIAGKAHSFRNNSQRFLRKLSIDPYTISLTYGSYLYRGITRVIKDTMKRY